MGTSMDFNTAPSQDSFSHAYLNNDDRVDRIKSALHSSAESALSYLFPLGKIERGRFKIGNLSGAPGNSLVVELTANKIGVWSDFATGHKGGDLIELWKHAKMCTFAEALQQIERWLSLPSSLREETKNPTGKPKPTEPGNGHDLKERNGETRQRLGAPTKTWIYPDESGTVLATHSRYDTPDGKKEFRPWDAKTRKATFPDPRPLYNIPEIVKASRVIFVEGEKCADALAGLGICATTAMGGANAPMGKIDWKHLIGKEVWIWPDNDEPGKKYAANIETVLKHLGVMVKVIEIPNDKPQKWDAADAVQEGFDVKAFLFGTTPPVKKPRIFLDDWCASELFTGDPPERRWLVSRTIPMGSVTILAAMGDAGKGMLSLDLALKIAGIHKRDVLNPNPMAFGNEIIQHGSVVIFTAEDDKDEVHRRIKQVDRIGLLETCGRRLIVIPLPNTGGPAPLVVPGPDGPVASPMYQDIRTQLMGIKDLVMIVFDPLASFVTADVNADPAVGAFVTGLFSSLATETGASVVLSHHLGKTSGGRPITSPEEARDKIRGTTAIVDGVRAAYVIWAVPMREAENICKRLDTEWAPNKCFYGALVKSNGPGDRNRKVFVRDDNGLLVPRSEELKATATPKDDLMEELVYAIATAAENGRPFTVTGAASLWERGEELSEELAEIGKNRIQEMARELLMQKRIFKAKARGSNIPKWLDVQGGPFFDGEGVFSDGFVGEYKSSIDDSRGRGRPPRYSQNDSQE